MVSAGDRKTAHLRASSRQFGCGAHQARASRRSGGFSPASDRTYAWICSAHYNWGVALQEQWRIEEALASYNKAVEIQPDMVDARWNRAVALLSLGNY